MHCSVALTVLSALISMTIASPTASALDFRVFGDSSSNGMVATDQLVSLGHTINAQGNNLANYDQVWELRSDTALTSDDITALSAYAASGGPLLLTGDGSSMRGPTNRNDSLITLVDQLGGGTITSQGGLSSSEELITAAGQVVNFPNFLNVLSFGSTELVTPDETHGFLVSQSAANPDAGSMIGWDFGELDNALTSRMLVAFDNEFFDLTGPNWTENMVNYLGTPIPEPSASLLLLGGVCIVQRRVRVAAAKAK